MSSDPNILVENNSGNRGKLEIGQLVLGEIVAVDPQTGLCRVHAFYPAQDIDNCVWLTKALTAPLLGYRIKSLPAEGTKVVVLYGSPTYIIDIVDSPFLDDSHGRSLTGDGEFTREEQFPNDIYKGLEGSASLLEGEFEIENAFNVGISFLANLISIKAGDRAKIETHLLHDMVRVIAEQYHNITPLGEVKIYDDGRPNMEVNFGSYVHELLNLASPNQDKVNTSGYHVNFDSLNQNDPVKSFGHRFKTYLGFVGNFLNMFVSDPVSNLGAIASGKAQFHIGNSGDILLRTVSEVAIERVVRIAVPIRNKKSNDPSGHLSKEFDNLENLDVLKKWDYGQGTTNTIHQCAYSLRSYSRYLSNYASLVRFHQMSGENNDGTFTVPTEKDIPKPDMNNKEQDLLDANGPVSYIEGYSTIRIMRDGAVLTMDSTGGAVYHGRGIVEISAVKDVRIDSARDISLIAGRNLFLKAKQNIEVSSSEGGIVMKSRKLFNVLCEKGKLWLKSDAKTTEADYGVVIDSTANKILVNSKGNMLIRQEDGDLLMDSIKGSILSRSAKNNVISSAKGGVLIKAAEVLGLFSPSSVFVDTPKFNVANKLIVTGKDVFIKIKTYLANTLTVRGSIFGPAVQTKQFVMVPTANGTRKVYIPGEYNHIKKLTNGSTKVAPTDNIAALKSDEIKLSVISKKESVPFTGAKWKFQKSELDLPADTSKDALFIPFAQDFIETHQDEFSNYVVWTFEEDKLNSAPRTDDSSLPYPGVLVKEENYADFMVGEDLNKPATKPSKEWSQPNINTRKIQRKVQQ